MDLHKKIEENDEQYIWRLGRYKDSGLLDMSWDDLADVINKELGTSDSPLAEASYRKPYQQAKRFYDAGVFSQSSDEEYLAELRDERHELEKEKVKVRDERNELRRVLREQARKESFRDQIVRCIKECDVSSLNYNESRIDRQWDIVNGNDMIITLTDLHTGINIDNYFNTFNEDVLRERLNRYLDEIFDIQYRHGSENAYIIISEIISGIIHTTLRIENNQNVIEQFLTAVNYISEFLSELSYRFNTVNVYVVPGNHSRIHADKNQSLSKENFDFLIIPFLRAKFQCFNNIICHENNIEDSIAMFEVRGHSVASSHGDKDSPETVVQKFAMMFSKKFDIIILGHRHTNAMLTVNNTKVLSAGCMSGSDSYCMDKRLQNNPEQIVAIVDEEHGLNCFYDVKL